MTSETCDARVTVERGYGHVGDRKCGKTAKVQHEGRWLCGWHNPAHIEARRQSTANRWAPKVEERRRTQRLNAAAPALLEALREVLAAADESVNSTDDVASMVRYGYAVDIARALIAEVDSHV